MMTVDEVKQILNITSNDYDERIEIQLKYVMEDIAEISKHRYHEAGIWFNDPYLVFSSTSSTSFKITIDSDSTNSFYNFLSTAKHFVIDVKGSYKNDGYYMIDSISSSYVLNVDYIIANESSTDFATSPYIFRCNFTPDVKRIGAKMIWFNIQNEKAVQGNIKSETLGARSITYGGDYSGSYGIYPASLIAGLRRSVSVW